MLIEGKTNGKDTIDTSQRNIVNLFHAILKAVNNKELEIKLWDRSQTWRLRYKGYHLLVFSGTGPHNSEWITWDKKPIEQPQLEKVLRFEIDPYKLEEKELPNI
jgi:hypothetical protein